MALKKQHKARWNCNMGKYQPGRGTWPTPQNGKWPYLKFRLGTYIAPPPTHPYLSNTPTNLCMALFNFVIVFFVLYSYTFVHNFHDNTMPCINLSEYWTTLPHPRADLSRLTVLRTISWSHDEAQKSHGKQIHKLMEYTFWIFLFLPRKNDFHASVMEKSTVLRHIHLYLPYWSSCWQDKCQLRLSLPVCRI